MSNRLPLPPPAPLPDFTVAPAETQTTVFSCRDLATPGMRRRVELAAFGGGDSRVEIAIERQGTRVGGFKFFARDVQVLAEAIELAGDPEHLGVVVGEIPTRAGPRIRVACANTNAEPGVVLQFVVGVDHLLGRPTVIRAEEFYALKAALAALLGGP